MKAKVYCSTHNKMENVRSINFINETIEVISAIDCRKIMKINRIQELIYE